MVDREMRITTFQFANAKHDTKQKLRFGEIGFSGMLKDPATTRKQIGTHFRSSRRSRSECSAETAQRNNGEPHVPIESNAPNRTTASMLSLPCRDQYAIGSRFSQRANSSKVRAAPIPYINASNRPQKSEDALSPVPTSASS